MSKMRLLFKKEGRARYISHLDLMRTLQRAFARAGAGLKHSEGFNPHPRIAIALPLSVGQESNCELLDFELLGDIPAQELTARLNNRLPEGIIALEAYSSERKFKEIAWLEIEGLLFYDKGLPDDISQKLSDLFGAESIIVSKKSKKGMTDFDIIPCISSIAITPVGEDRLLLKAAISAQNPSLNPELLVGAISQKEPILSPDFAKFSRIELFDGEMKVFR